MQRLLTLLFSVCMMSVVAQAQVFTGSVSDEQGKPLARASVSAKTAEGKVVTFALTDKEGHFKLNLGEKKASVIVFSMMGRATQTFPIGDFKNGTRVQLAEQVQQLKEVKVKQQRIRQEGDTLIYSVGAFKQKNDRSIADVLARMPGIKVNENGTISYQGESINTFYVEGMDLMGGGYAQISENLQAGKVKNLEVYERHHRVKAKRGIEQVRSAALNLVLDDKAKGTWIGNLDIGTGTALQDSATWLRKLKWVEMMFGKKVQSVSIYKHANVNDSPNRRVVSIYVPSIESGSAVSFVGHPPVDHSRYLKQDSHMATTNWMTRLGKDATGRMNLYASYGHDRASSQGQTRYLDVLDAVVIDEFSSGSGDRQAYGGTFDCTLNADKTYLNNQFSARMNMTDSRGFTTMNNRQVRQQTHAKSVSLSDQISGFVRLRNKQTVDVRGQVKYSYNTSSLLLLNGSLQETNTHLLNANASAKYGHRLWKWMVDYTVGMNASVNRLALYGNEHRGEREDNSRLKWYVTPSTTIPLGVLKLSLSLPVQWLARSFEDNSRTDFAVDYRAQLSYEPRGNFSTALNYSNTWQPGTMPSHMAVYTDYRSVNTGIGTFEDNRNQTVDLSVKYKNLMWGFNGNMNASVTFNGKRRLYEHSLQNGVYQSVLSDYRHGSTRTSLHANGMQTLGFWKSMISVSLGGSHTSSKMLYQGGLEDCTTLMLNARIELSMQPCRFLSFKECSTISSMKQDYGSSVMPSMPDDVTDDHELRVYVMPGPFIVEWSTTLSHSNDERVSTCCFSDLYFRYRKKHLELMLSCMNLFGKKSYHRRSITTEMELYSIYTLRPREILATVSFDL